MRITSQTSQGQNSQDSQNWNTLATYDVEGPSLLWNLINQIEHPLVMVTLVKSFPISSQDYFQPMVLFALPIYGWDYFWQFDFSNGHNYSKKIGFKDANPLCSFNGSNIIWQGPKIVPKVWDSTRI